jgi:hypothetical protein
MRYIFKRKIDFADRTARKFMKVAQEFENSKNGKCLSISKVYALFAYPFGEEKILFHNFMK